MRRCAVALLVCAVALVPNLLSAQETPAASDTSQAELDALVPAHAAQAPGGRTLQGPEPNTAWGSTRGSKWIGASQFAVSLGSSRPLLTYAGNHFYTGSGRFFAQLDAEPGVIVDLLTCVYNDNSAADSVGFELQKYNTNLSTGTTTSSTLDSFATSGSPGVGFGFLDPADFTMSTTNGGQMLYNYYIAVDVTSNVSFAGCWVWYTRQVAPAPATATFGDVPTGHSQFRYVEALVAAGITGGCGGGNYCPNAPLTRGQMAVFLSVALGLGFPN